MAEIRLKATLLPRISALLWRGIVLAVVLLALYVSFGRYLTSLVSRHQDAILIETNARLGFVLEIEHMEAHWYSFQPSFELRGLRILGDEHEGAPVQIEELNIGVDVFSSLRTLSPRLFALTASGVNLHVDVTEDGQLVIPGMPASGGMSGSRLFDFIINTERLALDEVTVHMHRDDQLTTVYVSTELQREEDFRRFTMSLLSPSQKSWFRAVAEGHGEPLDFKDFVSDFHLEFQLAEVEYFRDLGRLIGLEWKSGNVESELWFRMDRGKISAAAEIAAQDLRAAFSASPEREFELEEVAAILHGEAGDGAWDFTVSDIYLGNVHRALQFETLRGEFGNGLLGVGTSGLDMEEVMDYLQETGLLPDNLAALLADLSPSGQLPQARLEVSDIGDFANSWRITGNFEELGVAPWKGAPGVENARGYFSIGRTDGLVQLQSTDFSLSFPKIYAHPLQYSEFGIQLEWDIFPDRFELRSGPFQGEGEEGEVNGLFAMDIPFGESIAGLEMDLLVGLQDAHPRYREKYLPFTLPGNLLSWLGDSIGDGVIEDGGFIWRGSLLAARPAYRTTQSYFDVAGAELNYHPDWPSLQDFQGLVLINDADVDVLGESARIRDSRVSDARVKVRQSPEKQLLLSVDAAMEGNAADGLAIVNDSPLRPLVGDVFSDWELEGGLSTRLHLDLNLSDSSIPPGVQLQTLWDDVLIDLGGLRLQVEHVSGELNYDHGSGFSAGDIRGSLWGRPLQATVSQGVEGEGLAELDVAVRGKVGSTELREWLGLDLLAFAGGETDVEMHIMVPPKESAKVSRITASSSLEGVSLDLPDPWAKAADSKRHMELVMPMVGELRKLELNLEQELFLRVQLGEEGYQAGSLGFGAPLQPSPKGDFVLGGEIARAESEQWTDFILTYLLDDEADPIEARAVWLAARDLHIAELLLRGETIRDVRAKARQVESGWSLDLVLPWARGNIGVNEDFSHFDVNLEHLDLDGIDAQLLEALQEGGMGEFQMPTIAFSVQDLWWQEGQLGNLAFSMKEDGTVYQFRDITGTLRAFELGGGEEGLALDWERGETSSTHIVGRISFQDFGDVLAAFNYERMVETTSGELDLDLRWPGGPTDYALLTAEGSLGIDVADGRFLKTSAATAGTLRVVSIFNLADFVRRLSLDLSYLFQSGVAFDSITGDVQFHSGQLEIAELDVLGRSSRFQFAGRADVPSETLQGELVATLPVASNLPWVAALISGLPAAAAVYVVSKLFTEQMDRFSSAVYSIEGAWNDPQVEFERIFDDNLKKIAAEAVAQAEADAEAEAQGTVGEDADAEAVDTEAEAGAEPEAEAGTESEAEAGVDARAGEPE